MNMTDRCRELLMQALDGHLTSAITVENGRPVVRYDSIQLSTHGSRLRVSFFFADEKVAWIDGPLPYFGGGDTATVREVFGRIPVDIVDGEWPNSQEPEPQHPSPSGHNRARRIRI